MASVDANSGADPHGDYVLGHAEHARLYERSAVPTLTIDHERRAIVSANPAALELFGLAASEVLGRPGTDLLLEPSPEDRIRTRSTLRDGETATLRQVPTASGLRTVELNIVSTGVAGVVFVQIFDLTDLLDATARADARAEELTSTTAALKTIGARLTHDLRSPMVAIAGFADVLLQDRDELDESQRRHILERICANTHALEAMTAAILGDADSARERPEDSSYQVDDLFSTLRAVTEVQLVEGSDTLETAATTTTLPVPVGTIRQALVNLVSNSIKYRDPTRPLRIEVTVQPVTAGTEIVVRDNGRGLPADPTGLFEAGVRGDTAEGTTGAGLGLAFVQAEVEAISGTIAARGLPEGAEFVIVVPDQGAAYSAQRPVAGGATSTALSGAQLDRVLEALPVAALVVDIVSRQVVRVNRAAVALLGFDEAEILGRPGGDFLDERDMVDTLRHLVIEDPTGRHMVRTAVRTARGALTAALWLARVEGTSLVVAQVVEDPPAEETTRGP